ncbi:hypothetical protein B0H13DRAFT_1612457 [Mycena leptocephala]|nr:hypothetical protein B0H13DRAFT_1612457 [Mycena leptocephala]
MVTHLGSNQLEFLKLIRNWVFTRFSQVCEFRALQRLKEDIDAHIALASPIRRLPEILQEIFLSRLPTKHNAVIDTREAPLLLGYICSYWRVSYAMPRLWTGLCIPGLQQKDTDANRALFRNYRGLCKRGWVVRETLHYRFPSLVKTTWILWS